MSGTFRCKIEVSRRKPLYFFLTVFVHASLFVVFILRRDGSLTLLWLVTPLIEQVVGWPVHLGHGFRGEARRPDGSRDVHRRRFLKRAAV